MIHISKEDFEAYEQVRIEGKTNMLDIDKVEDLSGLSRNKIKKIIKEYDTFYNLYYTAEMKEDKFRELSQEYEGGNND